MRKGEEEEKREEGGSERKRMKRIGKGGWRKKEKEITWVLYMLVLNIDV